MLFGRVLHKLAESTKGEGDVGARVDHSVHKGSNDFVVLYRIDSFVVLRCWLNVVVPIYWCGNLLFFGMLKLEFI
jgi:hypothetical protein